MPLLRWLIAEFLRKYHYLLRRAGQQRSDWVSPTCIILLMALGVAFIFSAQSYSGGTLWKQQILWACLGAFVYGVLSCVDYHFFLRHAHWIYGATLLLLFLLWTPLGQVHFGSRRWLNLGFLTFQPSDTAKVGVLIGVTSALVRTSMKSKVRQSLRVLLKVGVLLFLPIVLIFLQPDLGSSLVFPPMVFALLYASNLSRRFFLGTFLVVSLAVACVGVDVYCYHRFLKAHHLNPADNQGLYEKTAWLPLKDYQRNRVLAFVAPEVVDPKGLGISWNLKQSLISVGSGGIFGKGHNNGTQAKLGYLPQSVASNDFIFSVLTEEAGFLGGSFVLLLYAILIGNCIRIAGLARDKFGMLLAVGISVIFMTHIFVNIGMTIGVMPITGIPLPFISYGGSFVLICCALQGIVQSIYRFRSYSS